jgi:nucleoside-diphosphate-sugar epimerase
VTLLVTGASGYLGRHLCRRALTLGMPVVGTYLSRPLDIPGVTWHQLDVTSATAVDSLVRSVAPDTVIHTACAPASSQATDPTTNWATGL